MEYKEYKKDELEVGMEVAVPYHVYYGWRIPFRHPIWAKEKIIALTPKKTKITLDSGSVIELSKNYCYTKLYKYDLSMSKETAVARAFRSLLQGLKEIQSLKPYNLDDDKMIEVASKLSELLRLTTDRSKDDTSE